MVALVPSLPSTANNVYYTGHCHPRDASQATISRFPPQSYWGNMEHLPNPLCLVPPTSALLPSLTANRPSNDPNGRGDTPQLLQLPMVISILSNVWEIPRQYQHNQGASTCRCQHIASGIRKSCCHSATENGWGPIQEVPSTTSAYPVTSVLHHTTTADVASRDHRK